jgi:peptidoglycan-associated lipoprotein
MYRQGLIFCLAATLIFSAGCATKKVQDETAVTPPAPQTQAAPAVETSSPLVVDQGITNETIAEQPKVVVAPAPAPAAALSSAGLQSVPFEYDQHLLTDAAQDILAANAAILKAQGHLQVTLAGYCDERGADQYNIALGERRAEAVRNYLLSLGISDGRLEAVSYGEEKPVDPGHGESAWVKNRRVEFVPMS